MSPWVFHDLARLPRAASWPRSALKRTWANPQGDNLWAVQGLVDLRDPDVMDGPLVKVGRVGA